MEISDSYVAGLKRRKSKHKFLWQQQAEEVTAYFGASAYWLFHRYLADEIMGEFRYFQEQGDRDFQHFIGMLQWKKNNAQRSRTG